jgi:hypothetical protein
MLFVIGMEVLTAVVIRAVEEQLLQNLAKFSRDHTTSENFSFCRRCRDLSKA